MKRISLAISVVLALVLGACGGDSDSSSSEDAASGDAAADASESSADEVEITVGLLVPQTGFAANYGPEAQQGIDLALAELGVDATVTVNIITADEDVLDASQTLERLKKMVETDGAEIVIGPIFGSTQQAVAPYLSDSGIPWFSLLGASEDLAVNGSAFVWPGADALTAAPLGQYAAEDLGYTKIATLAPDYAYGQDVIAGAGGAFEAAGGEIVQQQWVPLGTTDMLQYATSLDTSVDALLMWLVPSDAASFVREYRNLDIDVPLLMFQGVFDPTFQEVGDQLIGEVGLNEYNPNLEYSANEAFVTAYEAEYGGIPNQTTAFAYTVMNVILEGVAASDGDTSLEGLRTALSGLALDTVIGPASYDADGIASSNRTVVLAAEADDGTYVWDPVKTYEGVGSPG
jgi:branched-chain amino acid transport system substrate-binding protein